MLKITYHKKSLKDLANVPSLHRHEIEKFIFELLPTLKTLAASNKFEKLSGYDYYLKARFGDYRLGAYYRNNHLELKRVLHRKEIYRFFP